MARESRFTAEAAGLGVLHEGAAGASVCVVLLNAGAMHRVGPFRLYVALARDLAQRGFPVLRLDQPGVGDAIGSASQSPVDLLRQVLDRLQSSTGCSRFVVGGICSAADLGWRLALRDPRVAGLLLFDPLARRAHPAFRLGQLGLHWRRGPVAWGSALRRLFRRRESDAGGASADDSQLRDWPAPGAEAGELARLVGRGVEVFALYTGGAAKYMTHPWQFLRGFGAAARDPHVRFLHWTECDHLFYRPVDRERLQRAVADWMQQRFGGA